MTYLSSLEILYYRTLSNSIIVDEVYNVNGTLYLGISNSSIILYTPGLSGTSGISGVSGTGISGFSGFSGITGGNGTSGFSGTSGYSGTSGTSGTLGTSGFSGKSGFSGISGFSGTNGISGVSGFSGTSGFSGVSGLGTSGFSGYSGGSSILTATNGTSLTSSDIRLGHASAGTGASNFTADRFLYLDTFTLQIGGSVGNDLYKFNNTGLCTITNDSLAVTQVDTKGLLLQNTTSAATGVQQISPSIHWKGSGWKTTATAASQSVDFRAYVLPIQGGSAPTSQWRLQSSINGAAYKTPFTITNQGTATFDGQISTGGSAQGVGGVVNINSSSGATTGTITANGVALEIRAAGGNATYDAIRLYNYWGRYYLNCMDDGTNATVSINNGTNMAATSSVLDVNSTTAGVLIPRMTTTQRTSIATPAEGLMVYDLTLHKLYVYDGTVWQAAW